MTESQPIAALRVANHHRFAIAAKRREIRAMDRHDAIEAVAALIEDTDDAVLLGMRVEYLLRSIPRVGSMKASRVLTILGTRDPTKKLRDLTDRQRRTLADAIRGQEWRLG